MAKNLLVIDDSSTIREAIQLALTGGEWQTVNAATGAEALDALRQHRVDAVLCDVSLAEEDGYEVCRTLGASAEGAGLPILLMGREVNATAAVTAGAAASLPKPFTAEQVQTALQEALERSDFSLDFDTSVEPIAVAGDDAPLVLEPLAGSFELSLDRDDGPYLEEEEVEVIDLGDDDQFDELELLEDLQPVEFSPMPPEAGGELFRTQDLGASSAPSAATDPEDLLSGPLPEEATADPDALEFAAIPVAEEPPSGPPEGSIGDEFDLEDLWADSTGSEHRGALDGLPMELGPDTAGSAIDPGQGQAGGWTVDGLQLGDEPLRPTEPDVPLSPVSDLSSWGDSADEFQRDTAEPEYAVVPTPPASEELQPLAEDTGSGAVWPDPETQLSVADLETDAPMEPPPAAPSTYSDLESGWAREATQQAAADGEFALDELLQPNDPEPSNWEITGEELWDEAQKEPQPETAGPAPEGALAGAVSGDGVEDLEPAAGDSAEEVISEETRLRCPRGTTEPSSAAAASPDTQALAAGIAAGAGQAVREALQQSLSAEHLAPLVAAAVERVAWEVVPQLAERLIRETIARLQEEPPAP